MDNPLTRKHLAHHSFFGNLLVNELTYVPASLHHRNAIADVDELWHVSRIEQHRAPRGGELAH